MPLLTKFIAMHAVLHLCAFREAGVQSAIPILLTGPHQIVDFYLPTHACSFIKECPQTILEKIIKTLLPK